MRCRSGWWAIIGYLRMSEADKWRDPFAGFGLRTFKSKLSKFRCMIILPTHFVFYIQNNEKSSVSSLLQSRPWACPRPGPVPGCSACVGQQIMPMQWPMQWTFSCSWIYCTMVGACRRLALGPCKLAQDCHAPLVYSLLLCAGHQSAQFRVDSTAPTPPP